MKSLNELFNEQEAQSSAKTRREIDAEQQRYLNDPEYRAKVDAQINKKQAEFEALRLKGTPKEYQCEHCGCMLNDDNKQDYDVCPDCGGSIDDFELIT